MSTRSYIAMKTKNENHIKQVKYIYCHFDGYIDGVGKVLIKNYSEPGDVENIFEHGDISSLPSDSSDIKQRAYAERPAETDSEYMMMASLNGNIHIEYVYLFKDNKWYVSEMIMETDKNTYIGYKAYYTKFKELKTFFKKKSNQITENKIQGKNNESNINKST